MSSQAGKGARYACPLPSVRAGLASSDAPTRAEAGDLSPRRRLSRFSYSLFCLWLVCFVRREGFDQFRFE